MTCQFGRDDVPKSRRSFSCTKTKAESKASSTTPLVILLINAFKEQQNRLETLRKQNAALNARLRGVETVLRKKHG